MNGKLGVKYIILATKVLCAQGIGKSARDWHLQLRERIIKIALIVASKCVKWPQILKTISLLFQSGSRGHLYKTHGLLLYVL